MTQEPDTGAEPSRPADDHLRPRDESRPCDHDRPGEVDLTAVRVFTALAMFGGLAVISSDWSWVVVGLGVAVMMRWPQLGGGSLAIMGGLVAFIGFVHGWSWVVILVGLLVMIFLHELGHFLTARWSGMKATEFFLGFGPKLWSFTRGETEYGVKAIPLGAYVRIIGMTTAEEVLPEDEDRTYRQKSFPKRLLVVSAGSLMHLGQALVAAVVLLVFVGVPGGTLIQENESHSDEWIVDDVVSEGSAADLAGLVEGDRIVEWDGDRVSSFTEVRDKVGDSSVGEPVTLTVERAGGEVEIEADLVDRLLRVHGGENELEPGMVVTSSIEHSGLVTTWDGEPVETADDFREYADELEVGDLVTLSVDRSDEDSEDEGAEDVSVVVTDDEAIGDAALDDLSVEAGQEEILPGIAVVGEVDGQGSVIAWDGEEVTTFAELQSHVGAAHKGDEAELTIRGKGGESYETTVKVVDPASASHGAPPEPVPFLGVGPTLEDDRIEDQKLGPVDGVATAGKETGEILWMTTEGIGRFFSPSNLASFFETAANGGSETSSVSSNGISPRPGDEVVEDPREMMSIYGIVRLAAGFDPAGLLILFFFVNLTIGLINMAPMLPLDGGHAIVAIYERLRSRNGTRYFVDADKLMPLAYAGLMLILVVGGTALFLDIVDPIEL